MPIKGRARATPTPDSNAVAFEGPPTPAPTIGLVCLRVQPSYNRAAAPTSDTLHTGRDRQPAAACKARVALLSLASSPCLLRIRTRIGSSSHGGPGGPGSRRPSGAPKPTRPPGRARTSASALTRRHPRRAGWTADAWPAARSSRTARRCSSPQPKIPSEYTHTLQRTRRRLLCKGARRVCWTCSCRE